MSSRLNWRWQQAVYLFSLLALCWLGMMAVHELGHVVGAILTGGQVDRVILHPLTISRTDVDPNPRPGVVVWLGPVFGAGMPWIAACLLPRRFQQVRQTAFFFAGFCLIANGAYIGFGAFDRVGDCKVMLQQGAPFWSLLLFGAISIPMGLLTWHRLGSLREFLTDPRSTDPRIGTGLVFLLILVLAAEFAFSPI